KNWKKFWRKRDIPKKRIWRREWLTRRESQGASTNLISELRVEDPKEYRMMLRMTTEKFDCLLGLITPLIQREDTIMRDAIKPETMLEVTLNYLATGNNYRTLSHLLRVSKSAISIMISIVCETVYDCLKDFLKFVKFHACEIISPIPASSFANVSSFMTGSLIHLMHGKKVAKGFEARWNIPFCCGAIDDKHVLIEAPPHTGSEYFNYKGSFSVVLMAIVGHNYCFPYFEEGTKRSNSDGGIFQNNEFSEALEEGLLPDGCFFVGDDAFTLKS
ncbi:unnamed protein product, partial [Acanthoscelides obtectus]